MAKYEAHDFYCMRCGQKVYALARNPGMRHEKHHRKKLYCYHCKMTLNCIECKNDYEVQDFKQKFAEGVYENEWQDSLDYVGATSVG